MWWMPSRCIRSNLATVAQLGQAASEPGRQRARERRREVVVVAVDERVADHRRTAPLRAQQRRRVDRADAIDARGGLGVVAALGAALVGEGAALEVLVVARDALWHVPRRARQVLEQHDRRAVAAQVLERPHETV